MKNKGIFCLSFDVEGEFGRKHLKPRDQLTLLVKREQNMVEKILQKLDAYDIRATFAVVGRMFQQNQVMIKKIRRSGHEVGSHSLTHADFQKLTFPEAEFEIKELTVLAKRQQLQLRSFVFPFNHVSHPRLLFKYGFSIYRTPPSSPLSNILSFLFPRGSSLKRSHKLFTTTGSLYFPSKRKLGKMIPKGMRFYQAKKGINHAIKTGTIFHMWTHPIDLIDPKNQLFQEFEQILKYVSKMEKAQKLSVRTMEELPNQSVLLDYPVLRS